MYLKLHPDDPETAELTRQAIESLNMEGHLTADAILRAIQEQNAKHRAILEKCDGRYFEIAREIEDFLFDFITSNKDKIVLERQIRSRLGVNCNKRKLSSKTFAPVIRVSTNIFPG